MHGLGLLVAGIVGGLVADVLGMPAGVVVGSLLGGGVYRLAAGDAGPWRDRYGHVGRLLLGTVIGAAFGPDVLTPLKTALLSMLGVIACLVGGGMALGWGMAQVTSLDLATALLSSVPGGASTMPAVAHDLGGDMRLVAALHLMRQLAVLAVLPTVLSYVFKRRARRPERGSAHRYDKL